MGAYKFNDTDLSNFGFIPGRHPGSDLALSGFLDLPARTGKTFHNWIDENDVEPYVSAEDIKLGGRTLLLTGYIKGTDRIDLLQKSRDFEAFVKGRNGLFELDCDWGTFHVQVRRANMDFLHQTMLTVAIELYEPVVPIDGVIPGTNSSNRGIDGISLSSFGADLISMKGGRYGLPVIKENEFYTAPFTESPILEMELFIQGVDYSDFASKVRGLQALFVSPGTHFLVLPNDTVREFFVTDGFKVDRILSRGGKFYGFLKVNLMEVQFGEGYSFDVDEEMDLYSITPGGQMRMMSMQVTNNRALTFELNDRGELIMII